MSGAISVPPERVSDESLSRNSGRPTRDFHMRSDQQRRLWTALRVTLTIVGIVYMAKMLTDVPTWADLQMPFSAIAITLLLLVSATASTTLGWAVIHGRGQVHWSDLVVFVKSIPSRHIPGAIWQGVSQVEIAAASGHSRLHTVGTFLRHAYALAAANAWVALVRLTDQHSEPWMRIAIPLGAILLASPLLRPVDQHVSRILNWLTKGRLNNSISARGLGRWQSPARRLRRRRARRWFHGCAEYGHLCPGPGCRQLH